MPPHFEACAKRPCAYGLELSEDQFYAMGGWPTLVVAEHLVREQHSKADPSRIAREKEATFEQHLADIRPIEPVVQVVRQHRGRLPIAVATGAIRPMLDAILEQIGLTGWFDALVSSEDVPHHKPAPDIFLEACAAARRRAGRLPGLRRFRPRHRGRPAGGDEVCRRAHAVHPPCHAVAGKLRDAMPAGSR